MQATHLEELKSRLASDFVPHLRPLLEQNNTSAGDAKNLSRAFSAFCLHKLLGIDEVTAANSVIDDFHDNGVDAIYYQQSAQHLYVVQGKLKADEPFSQTEALKLKEGLNDLVNQRYERFNQNVLDRQVELEDALDEAREIAIVIAYTGNSISNHAVNVLTQLLSEEDKPDMRLQDEWIDFGPTTVQEHIYSDYAVAPVNGALFLKGAQKVAEPRATYYGHLPLADLVDLYEANGDKLLEKNIRYFLGMKSSSVNRAIHDTLEKRPDEFFLLSNGVTAIAETVNPGSKEGGKLKLNAKGLSIINGAQTVASSHNFVKKYPDKDIASAHVMFTIVEVDNSTTFATDITKARNHQNPVAASHFAALDNTQERLRRELAAKGIEYRYRPEAKSTDPETISIDESAIALALLDTDPGVVAAIKLDGSRFLDADSDAYAKLFNDDLTGVQLANSVRLYRFASGSLKSNEDAASGQEKMIYRHGKYAILWLVFRSNMEWRSRDEVMSSADAAALVSSPLDAWREKVRSEAVSELGTNDAGPLAFFRSHTHMRPFAGRLLHAGT